MIDNIDVYQKLISNSFEKIPKLNLASKKVNQIDQIKPVKSVSHARGSGKKGWVDRYVYPITNWVGLGGGV